MPATAEEMTRRRIEARDNKLEDAEFLIHAGEWPDRIARRVGYRNAESLAVALNRAGRQDLTAKLRSLDRCSTTYQMSLVDDEDRRLANERHGRR